MRHPQEGAVEQDPHDIRDCLLGAIGDCLDEWGGDPRQIVGSALTTQRSTVLPADSAGQPLTDAVSWLDRRTASPTSEPSRPLRMALELLGDKALVPRLLARSWPRQWRERQPAMMEQVAHIASIEAWLHHELVGRMALAPGGVVGPWPFDVAKRRWSGSALLCRALGYERRWLPEIVDTGQRVGTIRPDVAKTTGLPADLPLYACGGDKQAEALGAGLRLGVSGAAISLGTASTLCAPTAVPRISHSYRWFTLAAAEPESFLLEYMVFRGMWTVGWFARELARDLHDEAIRQNCAVEGLLCAEAEDIRAGSDGLLALPRWSPSLQYPAEAGAWLGLRETHSRGHMYRALLEGIAFDLRRGREVIEKAARMKIDEVRVGGGGARSPLMVQILADVLGVKILKPESEELAARGAAIVAAVGAGLHSNVSSAVEAMVPQPSVVLPNPIRASMYKRRYKEAYLPELERSRRFQGLG